MRCAVWIGFLVGTFVGLGSSSNAQNRQGLPSPPVPSQVAPETDRSIQQALDDATKLIDLKQFVPAIMRLQAIFEHSEDYFLEKDFRSKSLPHASIRSQTLQILADLPAEGRAAYESEFGPVARDLLKQAFTKNDPSLVARVVAHYQMTSAGFDALQFLAASATDRDQPLQAAFLCEAMLTHPRAKGPLHGPLLLQSAMAWYLAGQYDRSLASLEALQAVKLPGPWRLGGRLFDPIREIPKALDWFKTHFGLITVPHSTIVNTWSLPRGGSTGNESAMQSYPVGDGLWTVSSRKHLRLLPENDLNQQRIEAFDELTRQIERTLRENDRLSQPAAVPLIVGDVVVYRTLNDVTAVSLKTGRLLWRSSTSDGMLAWLFQSTLATSESMPSSSLLTFRGYLRFKLFRDQLSGSLSSDGRNVYAIEESESQFSRWLSPSRTAFGAPFITEPTNKLVAYELSGGRLSWEIGGQSGTPPIEFSNHFFLGPPLPSAERLYCLAESKNEIRLVSIIPEGKSARLEWSQALVTTNRGFYVALRRFSGLVPAVSEGIAVCPTSNGSVVAFDLVQRQLRWGYSYDAISNRNMQASSDFMSKEEEDRWLDSGPIIANGSVIVTPRDSAELHCLNLVDGTLAWKRQREQALYVACVNGEQGIVIGRTQISAYSLADGTDVWKEPIEIPEPSGRGVRIEAQYLLPLSTGEIATVDLVTGHILGRSKLSDRRIPGNLAIGEGALVSCGTHEVIGFRPLADVENQIARQLKSNPIDAESLALRAELKLHRGKESEAIEDLRQSLGQQPQLQVKRILAEILLNRLRNNPAGILKSATELEALTQDPRQRIEFIRLYAAALSETGDHAGATTLLIRLVMATPIPDELTSVSQGHFVSLEQSIRSQLFSIYESAEGNQKAGISAAFAADVDGLKNDQDRNQRILRFVKLTVGHPAADRILLQLAESKHGLPDDLSRMRLLERLANSENKSTAASAVATIASRLLSTNVRQDALPWIEKLREMYPTEVCREGKTGRQLSDEWLSRPEFLQKKDANNWPEGKIKVERTEEMTTQATFAVDVVTRVGHQFDGWTFETDSQVTTLTARDRSLSIVWRLPLVNISDELRGQPSQIHIRGRRLAFSSGTWLAVMEVLDSKSPPRILFDQSLRPNSLSIARSIEPPVERRLLPNGRRFQLMWDARGTAGFLIGLSDEAVCYQLDNRLYAADPETGRILWSRTGPEFAKRDGTIDRLLVLNTPANGALLLRARDGTLQERIQGSPHDVPLWFHGTWRLSQRDVSSEQRLFEMRDLEGDRVVWQSQHPTASMPGLIDNKEVGILEPSGTFSILKLDSGKTLFTTELPAKRPQKGAGVLAVQRWKDRYLVVAGVNMKNSNQRNVAPLNIGAPNFGGQRDFAPARELGSSSIASFTVDGFVCSVNATDGTLQWSERVSDLAYDTAQPSSLPVLVLASWQADVDRFGGLPMPSRLSVLILDKRTGNKVYEKQEPNHAIGRGVQFNPMIDDRKLVIDFYNWQLNLTFEPK